VGTRGTTTEEGEEKFKKLLDCGTVTKLPACLIDEGGGLLPDVHQGDLAGPPLAIVWPINLEPLLL
jgi:hypothetical protein